MSPELKPSQGLQLSMLHTSLFGSLQRQNYSLLTWYRELLIIMVTIWTEAVKKPSRCALDGPFEVLGNAMIAAQPREGAFDGPVASRHFEALCAV